MRTTGATEYMLQISLIGVHPHTLRALATGFNIAFRTLHVPIVAAQPNLAVRRRVAALRPIRHRCGSRFYLTFALFLHTGYQISDVLTLLFTKQRDIGDRIEALRPYHQVKIR